MRNTNQILEDLNWKVLLLLSIIVGLLIGWTVCVLPVLDQLNTRLDKITELLEKDK